LKKLIIFLLLGCAHAGAAWADFKLHDAVVQGALVRGEVAVGDKVFLDGAEVRVAPNGQFVFGIGRDRTHYVSITVHHANGSREELSFDVAPRQFNIERIDGLPPKTVTPPESWLARRKIENGRVAKGRAQSRDNLNWQEGFILPSKGRYSGFYGSQRILNGKPRSPHYGIDIAAPTGTPVLAPAGGVVTLAAPDFLLEGGIIIIDHGYGVTSTLFHLESVDVAEGDVIAQGAQIGTVGATGRATGPHVDWRINWGKVRVDPMLVLPKDQWPDVTKKSFVVIR